MNNFKNNFSDEFDKRFKRQQTMMRSILMVTLVTTLLGVVGFIWLGYTVLMKPTEVKGFITEVGKNVKDIWVDIEKYQPKEVSK